MSTVDDFEDGDISEYGGSTGAASVVTSPAKSGSNALEYTNTQPSESISSVSGLNAYPSPGDTFRTWVRTPSSSSDVYISVHWAVQSETSYPESYYAYYNMGSGEFAIGDIESGSIGNYSTTSVSLSTSTWYEIEISWGSSGSIQAELLDESGTSLATLSATNTKYSSGGVAFGCVYASTTDTFHFDNCRITSSGSGGSVDESVNLSAISSVNVNDQTPSSAGWYDGSWQYRKQITIDSTEVTGSLTDYPAYIKIIGDTDLASSAQNSGDDILFTAGDGTTKLDHEIENYDGSNGDLHAFVEVPSLSDTNNTQLHVYYGNSGASNQENISGMWNDYQGVYHFHDDPSGGTLTNSAGANGTVSEGSPVLTSSIIHEGWDMAGNTLIDFGSDLIASADAVTLEFWYNDPSFNDGRGFNTTGTGTSQTMMWADNENGFDFIINGTRLNGSDTSLTGTSYQAARWDGSTATSYKNGSVITSTGYSGTLPDTGGSYFGAEETSQNYMDEVVDELRVSTVDHGEAYIETTYANINTPGTFITIGNEETDTGTVTKSESLSVSASVSSSNTETGVSSVQSSISTISSLSVDDNGFITDSTAISPSVSVASSQDISLSEETTSVPTTSSISTTESIIGLTPESISLNASVSNYVGETVNSGGSSPLDVWADATIPTGADIIVTVREDTNADGVVDNSARLYLNDGFNEYQVNGFDGSDSNDIWLRIEYRQGTASSEPSLDDIGFSRQVSEIIESIAVSTTSSTSTSESSTSGESASLGVAASTQSSESSAGSEVMSAGITTNSAYTESATSSEVASTTLSSSISSPDNAIAGEATPITVTPTIWLTEATQFGVAESLGITASTNVSGVTPTNIASESSDAEISTSAMVADSGVAGESASPTITPSTLIDERITITEVAAISSLASQSTDDVSVTDLSTDISSSTHTAIADGGVATDAPSASIQSSTESMTETLSVVSEVGIGSTASIKILEGGVDEASEMVGIVMSSTISSTDSATGVESSTTSVSASTTPNETGTSEVSAESNGVVSQSTEEAGITTESGAISGEATTNTPDIAVSTESPSSSAIASTTSSEVGVGNVNPSVEGSVSASTPDEALANESAASSIQSNTSLIDGLVVSEVISAGANAALTILEAGKNEATEIVGVTVESAVSESSPFTSATESVSSEATTSVSGTAKGILGEALTVATQSSVLVSTTKNTFVSVIVGMDSNTTTDDVGIATDTPTASSSSTTATTDTAKGVEEPSIDTTSQVSQSQEVTTAIENSSISSSFASKTLESSSLKESIGVSIDSGVNILDQLGTQLITRVKVEGIWSRERIVDGTWSVRRTTKGVWDRTRDIIGRKE